MTKIYYIIQKNIKQITRAKTSAFIVILGPIILALLLGLAFSNTTKYAFEIGVYAKNPTNLTAQMISVLGKNQFNIIKYTNEKTCIDAVKKARIETCIVFPEDFEIKEGTTNQIVFHVDFSKINLVYLITEMLTRAISTKTTEISKFLTQSIVEKVMLTNEKLSPLSSKLDILVNNEKIVGQKSNEVYDALTGMDLTYAAFDITPIETNSKSAISSMSDLQTTVRNNLKSIKSEAEDLAEILGENSTNGRKAISIKNKAESALSKLDQNYNSTNYELKQIDEYINSIKSDIESTKNRLRLASSSRDEAIAKMETIKGLVGTSQAYLAELNSAVKLILAEINSVEVKNATSIVSPITTKIEPLSIERSHFNNIFPTLVILIIMITGILFSSTIIISEKKSRAFLRNILTPTNNFTFDLSHFLTSLAIVIFQLIIFILLSVILFGVAISQFGTMCFLLIIIIGLFVFIGMVIGYLFNSEETNTLASVTIIAIFLFFSAIVLPLESMPMYIQKVASLNPFVVSEILLKQSVFFEFSFTGLRNEFILILFYLFAIFLLLILVQTVFKKTRFLNLNKIAKIGRKIIKKKS